MKSVGIYKDIDSGGDGFKLISVTEAYSLVKEGKELYFLNSENNEIKIKTIEKERYYGKIYDVDVENDVVLIKRNNLVVCSGNGVEHNFTSLADERCMILGEKMNKIEEVNKK